MINTNITTNSRLTLTDQTQSRNDIQRTGNAVAELEGADNVMIRDSLPSLGRFAA